MRILILVAISFVSCQYIVEENGLSSDVNGKWTHCAVLGKDYTVMSNYCNKIYFNKDEGSIDSIHFFNYVLSHDSIWFTFPTKEDEKHFISSAKILRYEISDKDSDGHNTLKLINDKIDVTYILSRAFIEDDSDSIRLHNERNAE